jgi:hypothetical protein
MLAHLTVKCGVGDLNTYLILFIFSLNILPLTEDSMASSDWKRVTTYRKWREKNRSSSNYPDTWLDSISRIVWIPVEIRSRPVHTGQRLCLSRLALRFEYLRGLKKDKFLH